MEPQIDSDLIKRNAANDSRERTLDSMKIYFYRNVGVIGGIITGIVCASMEVAAKSMTGYYPPAELAFLRYLIQFPLNISMIVVTKDSFKPPVSEIKYLLAKGLLAAFAYILMYTSFVSLPYFDSFVVIYGVMVISSIIVGRIWLKERISIFTSAIFVVVTLGIVLIALPAFEMKTNDITGYLCSIVSGISMAIAGCTTRKIKETPLMTFIFYLCLSTLLVCGVVTIIENDFKFPVNYKTVFTPLFIGCCSVTMQTIWNKSLQISDVSKPMLAIQCEIPVGFLLQWLVFHEFPPILSIIGSLLIFFGVICTILEDVIKHMLCRQTAETVA